MACQMSEVDWDLRNEASVKCVSSSIRWMTGYDSMNMVSIITRWFNFSDSSPTVSLNRLGFCVVLAYLAVFGNFSISIIMPAGIVLPCDLFSRSSVARMDGWPELRYIFLVLRGYKWRMSCIVHSSGVYKDVVFKCKWLAAVGYL